VCYGFRKAMAGMFPFPLLTMAIAVILVSAGIIIAIMSAAVPAWFASRKNVVESLRYSG
jgi:ABC-type antimicrobial peptide transport system permease subunit